MAEQLFLEVEVVGGNKVVNTKKELVALRKEQEKILNQLKPNTEAYKQQERAVAQLKAEEKELTKSLREQTKAFQNQKFPTGSINAYKAEIKRLTAQYKNLTEADRNGTIGQGIIAQINPLQKKVGEASEKIKGFNGLSGAFKKSIGEIASTITARLAPIALLGKTLQSVNSAINRNLELSDNLADVRKTTGLTADEVDRLRVSLNQLDTRTNTQGLLEIAEGAGRLGIEGVDNILNFTRVVDKAVVALGDDLGKGADEIATDLGKIVELFNLGDGDTAEGINQIGSVINELAANTKANAGNILAFLERVEGIGATTDFGAGNLAGFAATVDEAGLKTELSSGALTRFLVSMSQDLPKFAKVAGKSLEEFSKTAEDDVNKALIQVLKGARNTSGGLVGLEKTVKSLGITSVGEVQTIVALADNIESLEANQAIANDQLERANSLTDEFNIKNNTAAASVEKLENEFRKLTQTSLDGGFYQQFIDNTTAVVRSTNRVTSLIGGNTTLFEENLISAKDSIQNLTVEIEDLTDKALPLVERYKDLAAVVGPSVEEQEELAEITAQLTKLVPESVAAFDSEGKAIRINTAIIDEGIKSRKALREEARKLSATNTEILIQAKQLQISELKDQEQTTVSLERIRSLSIEIQELQKATRGTKFGDLGNFILSLKDIEESEKEVSKTFQELIDRQKELKKSIQDLEVAGNNAKLLKEQQKEYKILSDRIETINNQFRKSRKRKKEEEKQQISLAKAIENTAKEIEEYKAILETKDPNLIPEGTLDNLDKAQSKLEKLKTERDKQILPVETIDTVTVVANELEKLDTENLRKNKENAEEFNAAMEDGQKFLESYAEAFAKLSAGTLSFEEFLAKLPGLLKDSSRAFLQDFGQIADVISEAFDVGFEALQASITKEENAFLSSQRRKEDAIKSEFEEKINAAKGNAVLQDQLRKEEQQKILAIEKETFEEKKRLAIKAVNIATAQAIVQQLATATDPVSAGIRIALVIATGEIQKDVIRTEEFADGGIVGGGKLTPLAPGIIRLAPNIPTKANGDNIFATVRKGEAILNEAQQRRIGFATLAAAGVPGFTRGGLIGQDEPALPIEGILGPAVQRRFNQEIEQEQRAQRERQILQDNQELKAELKAELRALRSEMKNMKIVLLERDLDKLGNTNNRINKINIGDR